MRVEGLLALTAALGLGVTPAVVRGESYDDAMAQANALVSAGEFSAAAARLAPLQAEYAQDYPVHLLYAYCQLRTGRFAEALEAYRVTQAISDTTDARWGIADALSGVGDLGAARVAYRRVLELAPEHAEATARLALLGTSQHFSPAAHGMLVLHSGEAGQTALWAVIAGLEATLWDRWGAVARYRHLGGFPSVSSGRGRGAAAQTGGVTFAQDEGYLNLGYRGDRWGAALLGAGVSYRSSEATPAAYDTWLVGAQGSVTVWARFVAAVTHSTYVDLSVEQLNLEVSLPLTSFLDLRLGGEGQLAAEQGYGNGTAELILHNEVVRLAVRGGLGERFRPVELDLLSVYNVPARPIWGARAQVAWSIDRAATIHASYEFERQRTPTTGGATETNCQRIALGLGLNF